MTIGTGLNIDTVMVMSVVVGTRSVEFAYGGTDIEMDGECLARFIGTGADALAALEAQRRREPVPASVRDRIGVDTDGGRRLGRAVSTWVVCDVTEPISYMPLYDSVELQWGGLVWTIERTPLARLLDRARRAQSILAEHLASECRNLPDVEIPEPGQDQDTSSGTSDTSRDTSGGVAAGHRPADIAQEGTHRRGSTGTR